MKRKRKRTGKLEVIFPRSPKFMKNAFNSFQQNCLDMH